MQGFARTAVDGWITSIAYHPYGTIAKVTHSGGLTETWAADPDMMPRPQSISVDTGTTSHWTSGTYQFDGAGNIKAIGGKSYFYDPFLRLIGVSSGTATNFTTDGFAYDAFGNLIAKTASGCTGSFQCYTTSVSSREVIGTTNRFKDPNSETSAYDAAGNVLRDNDREFTYDAVSMATSAYANGRTFEYVYNADDERVAAVESLTTGGYKTTWTLRGCRNELLTVLDGDTWKEDEIWRGSVLAGYNTSSGKRHYGVDHLGSPRVVTNATGVLIGTQEFAPFGSGGTTGSGALQFTGHERDRANLGGGTADLPDYAHARFLDTGGGRFLSVDPIDSAEPQLPQSWNKYAYALNNPLKFTDPTGMYVFAACTGDKKQCQADQAAFEAARQDQLKSTDESLRNAAAAYGDLGVANGVTVAFATGKDIENFNGDITAKLLIGEQVSATYDVRIRSGMNSEDLKNAVVHEGEHVRNAMAYVSALQSGVFNPSLNLRLYQTEMNAYMVSWAFARTNNSTLKYNGMTLKGAMPKEQLRQEIDKFLRKAPYKLKPDTPRCQFSPCG